MPNIKSAKKRVKVTATKTLQNRMLKGNLKAALKAANAAIESDAADKAAVAQKAGLSKSDAAKVLGAFFETVSEELSKGQAVQIIGFGNFEVADYKARTGRNPQTGAVLEIPAGKRPKFTAGSALKKAVAG